MPTLPFSIASLIIAYTSINKVSPFFSGTQPHTPPIALSYLMAIIKIADLKKGVVISAFPCYNLIYKGSFVPTLDFLFNAMAHKQKKIFSEEGVVISAFPCYNLIYKGSFVPTLDFLFNATAHKQKKFFSEEGVVISAFPLLQSYL